MCGVVRINQINYKPGSMLKVLTSSGKKEMKWGISKTQIVTKIGRTEEINKILYNARIETVLEGNFWNSMIKNNCVLKVDGFYEKNQYFIPHFHLHDLWLPGLYNNENSFVLLTQNAGPLVRNFHHRQPILLFKDNIDEYIQEGKLLKALSHNKNHLKLSA
jgi:putative SOS response-associated peptidase YedK